MRLEDNAEFYETEYKCTTCKVKLIRLNDEESEERIELEVSKTFDSVCPKCGEKVLLEMMLESWD